MLRISSNGGRSLIFQDNIRAKLVSKLLIGALGILIAQHVIAATKESVPQHRSKFEPPAGKTILFIGQTKGEIEDYSVHAGAGDPPGYMFYTSLDSLQGVSEPFLGSGCQEAGVQDLAGLAREYPGSAAQIGLYIVGQLVAINSGQMDEQIRKLANSLRELNRPVFLRIGYEFDGPWNAYEPGAYRRAFQRIVSIFRGNEISGERIESVDDVAFVWHSAAWKTYGDHPIGAWYPGDRYVDWIGVSWFGLRTDDANKISTDARAAVLRFAHEHRKPVMIAESAPKKYFPPREADSWNRWYAQVFRWIVQNDIQGFSYINQNWDAQHMWGNPTCKSDMDWGDSRVQVEGSKVLSQWQREVTAPRFLKAGEQLFRAIGFEPPLPK